MDEWGYVYISLFKWKWYIKYRYFFDYKYLFKERFYLYVDSMFCRGKWCFILEGKKYIILLGGSSCKGEGRCMFNVGIEDIEVLGDDVCSGNEGKFVLLYGFLYLLIVFFRYLFNYIFIIKISYIFS